MAAPGRARRGGPEVQVEVLITPGTHYKGRALLESVHAGAQKAGIRSILTLAPRSANAHLVIYGLGGPDRAKYATRGNVISFDLGYWNRKGPDRSYRVSYGGFHCPGLIFKGPDPGDGRQGPMEVLEQVNREGPIMLVGNGPKSEAIGATGWSAKKQAEIRQTFPGIPIMYRPKPKRPVERGVDAEIISTEPIEEALSKASLVVCRHSNVAVDACKAGIPVVCDDGAAASIYPASLADHQKQPSLEKRKEFLRRLAYWQWTRRECESGEFWHWMKGIIK